MTKKDSRETYPICADCGTKHRPAVRYCPEYRRKYMQAWRASRVTITRNYYRILVELAQPVEAE